MLRILLPLLAAVLALPAATLTLARLSGSDRLPAVQAQAFAPLAIPLYVVLVPLLLAVVLRGDHRVLPAAAALLALAGLGLHLVWVAPLLRADAVPSGAGLTVMTANLEHGRADPVRLLGVARDRDVDLLVLQEVTPEALAGLDAAGVGATFPHRAGRAGPAADGTVVLARTPLSHAAPLATVPRSWAVTWRGLEVFAVHPAYPLHADAWRRELAALADEARGRRPALLVGDLNASLDHRPLRELLAVGYRDAAEQSGSGWQPTWPASAAARPFGVPLPPSVAIDHVLVGDGLAARATATVVLGGTDHRALLATLVAR